MARLNAIPVSCVARLAAIVLGVVAAVVATTIAGCASPPGVILQGGPDAPRWPVAPDPARIAYLGDIRGDVDLKPGRSVLARLGDGLFGAQAPKQMRAPVAVCTDGADRVFVADTNARVVHVFDLASRAYEAWAPPQGFLAPVALAYDPAGALIVSDSAAGDLVEFDAKGRFVRRFGADALERPCGIAMTRDRRLLIVDVAAHQIVVLDCDGIERARIGHRGTALGEFNFPTHIALDDQERLFVSDSLNFRVQILSPEFTPLRQIGSQGDLPGYFAQPKGIAVDAAGHVFVVDANFEAVQLFTSEGQLLMSFGREGHDPGEFWLPAGIHIDPKGRIWIADSYNQRVQAFTRVTQEIEP